MSITVVTCTDHLLIAVSGTLSSSPTMKKPIPGKPARRAHLPTISMRLAVPSAC